MKLTKKPGVTLSDNTPYSGADPASKVKGGGAISVIFGS